MTGFSQERTSVGSTTNSSTRMRILMTLIKLIEIEKISGSTKIKIMKNFRRMILMVIEIMQSMEMRQLS